MKNYRPKPGERPANGHRNYRGGVSAQAVLPPLSSAGEDRNGWLTIGEAVKYTPMKYQAFYLRVVQKREVRSIRPGNTGQWFVHRDDLAAWLNAGTPEEITEVVDDLA